MSSFTPLSHHTASCSRTNRARTQPSIVHAKPHLFVGKLCVPVRAKGLTNRALILLLAVILIWLFLDEILGCLLITSLRDDHVVQILVFPLLKSQPVSMRVCADVDVLIEASCHVSVPILGCGHAVQNLFVVWQNLVCSLANHFGARS